MKKSFIIFLIVPVYLSAPLIRKKKVHDYFKNHKKLLKIRCKQLGLDYKILHAQVSAESYWNEKCIEIVNGRYISFGYFQIGRGEWREFCRVNGFKFRSEWQLLYGYINIIAGTWLMARNLKTAKGCYKRALTIHNLGQEGAKKWCGKNGYFKRYISLLMRHGANL